MENITLKPKDLNTLIIASIILFTSTIIYSCSKSTSELEQKDSILKQYMRTNGGIFKNQTVTFLYNGITQVRHLDWDALEIKTVNGIEYTTIPFAGDEFNKGAIPINIKNGTNEQVLPSQSAFIIYRNESGSLQSKFRIRMYDTVDHKKINIYEFYYDTIGNLKYIWLYKPSYNPVRLYVVKNQSSTKVRSNTMRPNAITCEGFSFTTYNISCSPDQAGVGVTCNFSPVQNNLSICTEMNESLLPSDPGGGGAPPQQGTVTIQEIKNEMTNSCLNTIKNELTDTKLKSLIATLFNSTYGNSTNNVTVNFRENPNLTYSNGIPQAAASTFIVSTNTWNITMNPKFTNTASKEYLAASMLHEIVHSYIFFYKEYNGGTSALTEVESHTIMYDSWIDRMSGILMEVYGMSIKNAVVLSCFGISDILLKEGAPIEKINTYLLNKYKVSITDIQQVSEEYEKGNYGSKCQ